MKKIAAFVLVLAAPALLKAGTPGKVPRYVTSSQIQNSQISDNGAVVGIATAPVSLTGSTLTVNGRIESLLGGFKFPDGTIQVSSAPATGGIAVGGPVTGGVANGIIFEDGSQNVASSSSFTFTSGGGLVLSSTNPPSFSASAGNALTITSTNTIFVGTVTFSNSTSLVVAHTNGSSFSAGLKKLTFPQIDLDALGEFADDGLGNSSFTAKTAGYYESESSFFIVGATTTFGSHSFNYYVNGAPLASSNYDVYVPTNTAFNALNDQAVYPFIFHMNANDVLTEDVTVGTGGLALNSGSRILIKRVGR